jgi:hypothetical protein
MTSKEYHQDKATPQNLNGAVSKSLLFDFAKSPYKWMHGKGKKHSASMAFGSLVHALALKPEELNEEFCISPYENYRTKDAQAWRDSTLAEGKIIITNEEIEEANAACEALSAEILALGESEKELIVQSEDNGTIIKGMIDIAPKYGRCLADIKTCSSIESLDQLTRDILKWGYHWQAALYLDLYNINPPEGHFPKDQFRFIFIENESPFETAVVELSAEFIALGRKQYQEVINLWNECKRTLEFPKAINEIQIAELPNYYKNKL